MEAFYLEEYLEKDRALYNSDFEPQEKKGPVKNFLEVCSLIYDEFRKEWEHSSEKPEKLLALQ